MRSPGLQPQGPDRRGVLLNRLQRRQRGADDGDWCSVDAMASRETALVDITPEVLLKAYACGIFPMAESADDPALYWIEPERRGILPLERFHVPSRLRRTVRSDQF